jgi:hypothetical protein
MAFPVIYSTDVLIDSSPQRFPNFRVSHGKGAFPIKEFDTYDEAKRFAIARAREFGVAAYLWGHHELEPDIPNQSGYKRLC